jgi:RimJ/RimL family protein N-acetyltransferase
VRDDVAVDSADTPSLNLPLRTSRLLLRPLATSDLDDHLRLFSDPEVIRYLYDEPMDRAAAAEHLERRLSTTPPDEGGWLNLTVEVEGRYLGEVGVSLVSRAHRQCEVGYVFLSESGGHGYATEATEAMVDVAFDVLGAHRVVGRLDERNTASANVLERLGMRREAHFRENEWVKGEWTDEAVYAVTEAEWRARSRGQGVVLRRGAAPRRSRRAWGGCGGRAVADASRGATQPSVWLRGASRAHDGCVTRRYRSGRGS